MDPATFLPSSSRTLSFSEELNGFVDGVAVPVSFDLSSPSSYFNVNVHPSGKSSAGYRLTEVFLPDLLTPFRNQRVGLVPAEVRSQSAVILGRDWYALCVHTKTSDFPRVGSSYLDRILSTEDPESCIVISSASVAIEEARHGLVSGRSADDAFDCLVRHILCGNCVTSPSLSGCHELLLHVKGKYRQAVMAYVLARIQGMHPSSLPLSSLKRICVALRLGLSTEYSRYDLVKSLVDFVDIAQAECRDQSIRFAELEVMSSHELQQLCYAHGIRSLDIEDDELRDQVYSHIAGGVCAEAARTSSVDFSGEAKFGCEHARSTSGVNDMSLSVGVWDRDPLDQERIRLRAVVLSRCMMSLSVRALKRLLSALRLETYGSINRHDLQRVLKSFVADSLTELQGDGCPSSGNNGSSEIPTRVQQPSKSTQRARKVKFTTPDTELVGYNDEDDGCIWPRIIPTFVKGAIVQSYRCATGLKTLNRATCAVCGELRYDIVDMKSLSPSEFDCDILRDSYVSEGNASGAVDGRSYQRSGLLQGMVLAPDGVLCRIDGEPTLTVCLECHHQLTRACKLPRLSLANSLDLGSVPLQLQDLTPVEESMISLCRAKCWIIQLKEGKILMPNSQRGLRGHVIIFPQRPEQALTVLPPSVADILSYICVVFIGSTRPSDQWILSKAKPLFVRRGKVWNALMWLKDHNPLYQDVAIESSRLQGLPEDGPLPFPVHYEGEARQDVTTATYDPSTEREQAPPGYDPVFDRVVIADVDADTSTNAMRAAAMRHLKVDEKPFLEIPHGADPVNEFYNAGLFPMMYPTLFPYGRGGIEDTSRRVHVSMEANVRHMLRLADDRFQLHHSFMFVAFNILQRREALRRTKFKVDAPRFESVAGRLASISVEAVDAVTERVAKGDTRTANTEEEQSVLILMNEVKMITRHVSGSGASKVAQRNEIKSLMMTCGMPSFFLTINPADVYNPIVKFLAGSDIDVDCLLPEEVPSYWEQSILIARNPIVAASFFDLVMKSFFRHILGFGSADDHIAAYGGILGRPKTYYGCVEAQGRGTLHCHMLVWIRGALNPNEIRDRVVADPNCDFVKDLVSMLEDTISTSMPILPDGFEEEPEFHPCATRGIALSSPDYPAARAADLHHLVKQCQSHAHGDSCYKYWRGPPEPKECRFDLDKNKVRAATIVDGETGEIQLRISDGLINTYNETIIEAIRSNMDIKFIGSGQSAKAILYYVTDYITKSQLKAHVAFAALSLAVRKLGNVAYEEEDFVVRAKRLLQKSAYAMISHQELSAQQVALYLLGLGDHYTTHRFRQLWWTSFERAVEQLDPEKRHGLCDIGAELPVSPDSLHRDVQPTSSTCTHDDMNSWPIFQEDEVVIDVRNEELVAKSGAVADYLFRGSAFDDISVWDFVGRTEKIQMKRSRSGRAVDDGEEMDGVHLHTSERSSDHFDPRHSEAQTHRLRMKGSDSWVIPVPSGPSLPRRDQPAVYDRYCRSMLILFKAWRSPNDLKVVEQSWSSAFEDFMTDCPDRINKIINNMQLLHECRDSRDDHFAQRRSRSKANVDLVSTAWVGEAMATQDDMCEEQTEEDILSHLRSIDQSRSLNKQKVTDSANACVHAAEGAGLFSFDVTESVDRSSIVEGGDVEISLGSLSSVESEWRSSYDRHREDRKRRAMQSSPSERISGSVQLDEMGVRSVSNTATVCISGAAEALQVGIRSLPASEGEGDHISAPDVPSVTDMISEFTLNKEQSLAFRIICNSASRESLPPLRLYIGGSGGTGKSRIIMAVREFFHRRGESRRLRLASYTGVAAHNVSGMTLHAALSLGQRNGKSSRAKTRRELMATWEGVDFLFIDEISMVGCQLLLSVHQALTEAKCNPEPFGGINLVLAGDFAQLPPVGQTKLFAKLNTGMVARGGTSSGQKNILGKLLWLQVDTVVLLHQQMRQSGPLNRNFVDLLERLRVGKCSDDDYSLLESRLAANVKQHGDTTWTGVPILVGDNTSKDRLNEHGAEAFSGMTGVPLTWYDASDFHGAQLVQDKQLLEAIESFHSGQTGQRLYRLPLAKGMPVILTQNYDVEGGVINGCLGKLKYVRYTADENGRRRGRSCVIDCDTYTGDVLPHLTSHEIVALEDKVDIIFMHPHSRKKCTLKRFQLPVMPAFAMTVYKAQGLTFPRVVVDLEGCMNLESAYVMLSRVKSLSGLMVLRPFSRKKITVRQSEDLRKELERLQALHWRTIETHGEDERTRQAAKGRASLLAVPTVHFRTSSGAAHELDTYQRRLDGSLEDSRLQGVLGKRKRDTDQSGAKRMRL